MPIVREIIPQRFLRPLRQQTDVDALLDVAVTEAKFNNGSPCSGHAHMFADWPGTEPFVRQWFVLENGQALGINETPNGDWTFPVVDYES